MSPGDTYALFVGAGGNGSGINAASGFFFFFYLTSQIVSPSPAHHHGALVLSLEMVVL